MRRAAIAGVGMTESVAAHRQTYSRAELCAAATHAALEHAGASAGSIEAVVIGQIDGLEPTSVGGRHIAQQLGIGPVPVFVVSCGGATGASLPLVANHLIASGDYESVLCVGPPTFDGVIDFQRTLNAVYAAFDPPLAMGAVHYGAVMVANYQLRYGLDDEDIAQVVVKAHHHAAANPYAHLRNPVSVADVLATPMVATPLRVGTVCPVSSSAAALLLTTTAQARELRNPVVQVSAIESMADSGKPGGRRDFSALDNLALLARRVYSKAGIADPLSDLDVIEMFSPYAPFELMQYEALGLCAPGEGASFLRTGATMAGGGLPVNPSGGPLCGNAGVAAELAPFGYVALQLMGQAASFQVADARRGAAHSMGSNWFMCQAFGVLDLDNGTAE
jgi:acetyl-CoA C-acetyltransferase